MTRLESLEKLKKLSSYSNSIKTKQKLLFFEKEHELDINFYFTATFDIDIELSNGDVVLLEKNEDILSLSDSELITIYPAGSLEVYIKDKNFSSLFDEKLGTWVQNNLLQEYSEILLSLVKNIHSEEVYI